MDLNKDIKKNEENMRDCNKNHHLIKGKSLKIHSYPNLQQLHEHHQYNLDKLELDQNLQLIFIIEKQYH